MHAACIHLRSFNNSCSRYSILILFYNEFIKRVDEKTSSSLMSEIKLKKIIMIPNAKFCLSNDFEHILFAILQ